MQNGYANGHADEAPPVPRAPVTLLLVETDERRAERMEQRLNGTLPGLVATRCGTLASARAYLAGTAFDAVCTAHELPDGPGAALAELRDALGLRAPVFVWTRNGVTANGTASARRRGAGAACYVLSGDDEVEAAAAIGRALGGGCAGARKDGEDGMAASRRPASEEVAGLLDALRTETGAVAHAINNPLTVIAGNAQFLGELARMGGLDPAFARSVEDIEAAAQQLSEALGRLAALRQRIAASLGVADRL